jgi:hypothetical protein
MTGRCYVFATSLCEDAWLRWRRTAIADSLASCICLHAKRGCPERRLLLAGVYTIAEEGSDARLMYELEVPEEPQDVQQELNIGKTGNFSLQMKVCL